MSDTRCDAVVVGAGMLGAATAHRMASAGARVVLVDAGTPADAATGNSFAWLNAVSKEPEPYHRLNAAGMAEYERLEADLGERLRHDDGCLEWAGDAEAQASLDAKVARLQDRGYAVRWAGPDEVRGLEPYLRTDGVARAAFYERDAWVDAPAVVRSLLRAASAMGAEMRTGCRVMGFRTMGARVTETETSAGPITAEWVVLCAGTETGTLARQLGAALPIERRPGLLAVTTPVPAGTLRRVIYAPGFHIRPDAGGGVRIGADDVDDAAREGMSEEERLGAGGVLLERAANLLPALKDARLTRVHLGVRPVPADGHTIAGRLPGWENVFVAVTHSGITLGPLLGRLLAEEIASGRRDPLLAPFRPERFAAAR